MSTFTSPLNDRLQARYTSELTEQQRALRGSAATRTTLAANPLLPEDIQLQLALDSSEYVRIALAANPALTAGTQLLLTADSSPPVVSALGARQDLTDDAQLTLVHSLLDSTEHYTIQAERFAHLLENPTLTKQAMELLADFSFPPLSSLHKNFTLNPSLPLDIQHRLVAHPSFWVGRALAASLVLHPELQPLLAQSSDQRLLTALAANTVLLPELQPGLSYHSRDVRVALSMNPTLVLSDAFASSYCAQVEPDFFLEAMHTHNISPEWHSLAHEWAGSLSSFVQAHQLLS